MHHKLRYAKLAVERGTNFGLATNKNKGSEETNKN